MAGIYFHIPFCRQACIYCDFHFSTSLKTKEKIMQAMALEMRMRKDELADENIKSIYFGGGTPSILTAEEIIGLLHECRSVFKVDQEIEITLEANPDDLDRYFLRSLKDAGINRLSIGIQSFDDEELAWMNRAHNSAQASFCLADAKDAGFDNISADLIFATPFTTLESLEKNLDRLCLFNLPHLSCYNLTVEERTVLHKQVKENKVKLIRDEAAEEQFYFIHKYLTGRGYEHYEISNYALPGRYSRHNTSYWQREKYMGIGPAAHSFDGVSRSWNIRSNARYIESMDAKILPSEKEMLSANDKFNEIIFTGLRTQWGVNMDWVKQEFPKQMENAEPIISNLINEGKLLIENNHLLIPISQWIIADGIAAELFAVE
jgi:oxygen-independent coproporphyrinogen-3 oxidase